MISKEVFFEYMVVLEAYDMSFQRLKGEDIIGDYFDRLVKESLNFVISVMGDTEGWIKYYVYERYWGHKWEHGSVEINGELIPAINNLERLYDFLYKRYVKD